MSLPAGNPVVGGTVASATVHNNTMTDLATEITDSLSRSGKGGLTAALKVVDGTVGGPGVAFTSETSSGLYRAGANDLRMTVGGTARSKWTAAGFFADVLTALTAVGVSLKGAVADGATAVGAIIDNTISLATSGAKLLSIRTAGVEKLYVDKDGLIDGPGALGIGTATGTTLTLGRTGQTQALAGNATVAGTLGVTGIADVATIDRAGTIGIGTTSGTTVTVGRSGQTLAIPGAIASADIAVIDRAGTIGIGTTSGTTITIGRTGQTLSLPGTVSMSVDATTATVGSNWSATANSVRRTAGVVTVVFSATASNASAVWSNVGTVPVGFRPGAMVLFAARVLDDNAALYYPAFASISTSGTISVDRYDNGTSYVTLFTLETSDQITLSMTYTV